MSGDRFACVNLLLEGIAVNSVRTRTLSNSYLSHLLCHSNSFGLFAVNTQIVPVPGQCKLKPSYS